MWCIALSQFNFSSVDTCRLFRFYVLKVFSEKKNEFYTENYLNGQFSKSRNGNQSLYIPRE